MLFFMLLSPLCASLLFLLSLLYSSLLLSTLLLFKVQIKKNAACFMRNHKNHHLVLKGAGKLHEVTALLLTVRRLLPWRLLVNMHLLTKNSTVRDFSLRNNSIFLSILCSSWILWIVCQGWRYDHIPSTSY